jgi:hypothetical protein
MKMIEVKIAGNDREFKFNTDCEHLSFMIGRGGESYKFRFKADCLMLKRINAAHFFAGCKVCPCPNQELPT